MPAAPAAPAPTNVAARPADAATTAYRTRRFHGDDRIGVLPQRAHPVLAASSPTRHAASTTTRSRRTERVARARATVPPSPRRGDGVLERFRLDGKTAIVTGAGRGIGAATARALAEAGADVVLASRTAEQLEVVATDVRGFGGRALVIPTDVNENANIEALVPATIEEFGRVDIVVNNAGGTPPRPF